MGRGTTVLALFLVIFMVWMSGCADVSFGSQQLGDFGNTQEEKAAVDFFKAQYGNPATNSGPPRFLEPMVTTGLVNNTPVDKVTKFSKDTGSIWFWVFYDNFKKGDSLTLTWTYNGKDMLTQQKPAGGDFGRAFGEFLRPDSGWATGTHTITISGGGTSAAATFEIVNGPTETVPLPYAGELSGSQAITVMPTQQVGGMERMCIDPKKVVCSGVCVDPATDRDNCGYCGIQCNPLETCERGICTRLAGAVPDLPRVSGVGTGLLCPSGTGKCGASTECRPLLLDNSNCGECGKTCPKGSQCLFGTCRSPCDRSTLPEGIASCNGACIQTLSDTANCGGCGNPCPPTMLCVNGKCLACDAPWTQVCNGMCTVIISDNQNCGGCGKTCPDPFYPNMVSVCWSGKCDRVCDYLYLDRNGDISDGCEASYLDPARCGASGAVCQHGTTCCPSIMGQMPFDECVDLQSNSIHCGRCYNPCPATQICQLGTCTDPPKISKDGAAIVRTDQSKITAIQDTLDEIIGQGNEQRWIDECHRRSEMSGPTYEVCGLRCVDLKTDVRNCGQCGHGCTSPAPNVQPGCINGFCTNELACERGYADCNRQTADGCEVVLWKDPRNCGECGKSCPEGSSCCSGHCIHIQEDPYNCGACGTVCAGTEECCLGRCVVGGCAGLLQGADKMELSHEPSCKSGQFICGGVCSYLMTDEANCGQCGHSCSRGSECCKGICTDISFDNDNCGGCGITCPMTPKRTTCDMGECR